MRKYIDAYKLIAKIELLLKRNEPYCGNAVADGQRQALYQMKDFITSLQQEQPEVDYNIVPLPEERMASYIAYCLGREDDDCNCPTCGKHITGLRLFPYYYDRENNDVYFASICPECGKIIISKE